jgi:hypothetical protein
MAAVDVATAVGYGDRPAPRQLRLVSWQPYRKGPLRGFATIELPIGLKIFDVPVRTGINSLWAGLPAKPEIDRDGRRRTDPNGKPVYAQVLQWRNRELADRFSRAVVALVQQAHPDDLADEPRTRGLRAGIS